MHSKIVNCYKNVELSPSNVLLKIEPENNDEINTSQITKNTSVAKPAAVRNDKIVTFF